MNGTPWRTCPRLAADALRAVHEPGTTWLRAGRSASALTVARIMAAALQPPVAADPPPEFLRPGQHRTYRRLLAAIRRHRGALLADPVGSGKTWVALAVAATMSPSSVVAVIAPAPLRLHWTRVARELGVPVMFTSTAQVSNGQVPGACDLVIVDESHHFRMTATRRYGHLSRWLVGRRALLLSATPVVNRLDDLAAQLRLAVRDDALAASGVGSISALLASGTGHVALADVIVAQPPVPRAAGRSRTLHLPDAPSSLLTLVDGLELSREPALAALIRRIFWRALGSSPAALFETAARYETLLMHATAAAAAGRSVSRSAIRALTGPDEQQLVMWELMNDAGQSELSLADLPALHSLLRAARVEMARDDAKAAMLRDLVADGRPTLVFTTRRATVRYLRQRLAARRPAWCTGNAAGVGDLLASRTQLLDWFALGHASPVRVPDLLVATDVAAEGLDLARLTRVVHYDLPWTDARIEQREGRSRRGHGALEVEAVTITMPPALEARLELTALVERKRRLPGAVDIGAEAGLLWRWREALLAAVGSCDESGPASAAIDAGEPGAVAVVEVVDSSGRDPAITGRVALHLKADGTISEDPASITNFLARAISSSDAPPPSRAECSAALTLLAPHVRALLRRHEAAAWWRRGRGSARILDRISVLARQARRERDAARLARLEHALRAVGGGRTAGEDCLVAELERAGDDELARRAVALEAPAPPALLSARIAGLLVLRDGTLPFPNGRATFGRHEAS